MSNITMTVELGVSIERAVKNALELSNQREVGVVFCFNGIDMVVDYIVNDRSEYWVGIYNSRMNDSLETEKGKNTVATIAHSLEDSMSKQEKYEETVVDAASAKNKTAYFRGLQTAVVDCLHKVDKETVLGNDSVVVMVHRNYDLEDRSHVGDILRRKGFGVCDTDTFDFKGNNYRRIKVSW